MYPPRIIKLLIVVIILAFSGTISAEESTPQPAPQLRSTSSGINWTACSSNSECMLVGEECGAPQAVNRRYLKEYLEKFPVFTKNCGAESLAINQESHQKTSATAYCLLSRCMPYIPGSFVDPSFFLCHQDADCVSTVNVCGWRTIVNRSRVDTYNKMTEDLKRVENPPCGSIDPAVAEKFNSMIDKCLAGICTISPR